MPFKRHSSVKEFCLKKAINGTIICGVQRGPWCDEAELKACGGYSQLLYFARTRSLISFKHFLMKPTFSLSYASCMGYVVGGLMFCTALGYEFQGSKSDFDKINQTLKFFGGTSLIVLAGIAQSVKKEGYKVLLPEGDDS